MSAREHTPPEPDTYAHRIALRVAELRNAHGWSVDKMCDLLTEAGERVKPQTYRAWERGANAISPNVYPVIAAVFGFSTAHGWLPPK